MNARRYLIRLFKSGITNWPANDPDVEQLAKVFDLAEEEHSVYEVMDGEEEWLAAAAHVLTDPRRGADAVSVLRIDEGELARFGINV